MTADGGSAVLWHVSPVMFVEILTDVAATPPEDRTLLLVAQQSVFPG